MGRAALMQLTKKENRYSAGQTDMDRHSAGLAVNEKTSAPPDRRTWIDRAGLPLLAEKSFTRPGRRTGTGRVHFPRLTKKPLPGRTDGHEQSRAPVINEKKKFLSAAGQRRAEWFPGN